jgi:hypothetical protein
MVTIFTTILKVPASKIQGQFVEITWTLNIRNKGMYATVPAAIMVCMHLLQYTRARLPFGTLLDYDLI